MKTFDLQDQLPRLPVPELEHTAKTLYKSLLPFLESSQLQQTPQQLWQECQAFFTSPLCQQLQRRLQDHAKDKQNWLDKWWFQLAYLTWREPLCINSNWFMVFVDHPLYRSGQLASGGALQHPKLPLIPKGHVSLFQLYRTAGLISNAVGMKEAIENGSIEPEMYGRAGDLKPLCMNQYKMMFGWTRRAVHECDEIVCPGGFPCKSRHIIVLFKDQVYSVDVYDDSMQRLSIEAIQDQLMFIVNDVQQKCQRSRQAAICLLTGDHRDNWSEARLHLLQLSEQNRNSMATIESALFAVSLDDHSLPDNYDAHYQNIAHGMDGHNRWFDKSISIVTTSDGKAGMNGEHSPCDALIPSRLMDWLVEKEPAQNPAGAVKYSERLTPRLLKWNSDAQLGKYISRAAATLKGLVDNSDAGVLIFQEYGSEFMKKYVKVSPDAYVQMALQLAYYRHHGKWTATYETGSTRQFSLGRTETVRTCSTDAVNFVKTMSDKEKSAKEKYAALVTACKAHSAYTVMAMKGQGVDRHMLGLKMCLKPGESHPFLKNPLLTESTWFRLSTSSLSSGDNYNGTGFGAVVPDGYGINYCIGKAFLKFGIESKKHCRTTDTKKFRQTLVETLRDMRIAILQSQDAKL